jgi:hypothetical protein
MIELMLKLGSFGHPFLQLLLRVTVLRQTGAPDEPRAGNLKHRTLM